MKFLQKVIPGIFGFLFLYLLVVLYFFSFMDYHLKRKFLFSNLFLLIPVFLFFLVLFFCRFKEKEIEEKKYKKTMGIFFVLTLLLQFFLIYCIYFYTDWDVKHIRDIVNYYLENKNLIGNSYLTANSNQVLLTAIFAMIRSVPFLGKHYLFLLFINGFLVNLACLIGSLILKRLISNKAAFLGYLCMLPIIVFSPWITIPYSDTFSILIPVLILYLYSKQNKKYFDWFIIGLCAVVGYYIKPTAIIMFIAIIIVELFTKIPVCFREKDYLKYTKFIAVLICGFISGFLVNKSAIFILKFEPAEGVPVNTFIHYLAMGQNNKTLGAWDGDDVADSNTYGESYDIKKFKKRLFGRTFGGQVVFFTKKTLLNFNDGSFSWGQDGVFFYEKVSPKGNVSKFLREIYYGDGKYYSFFLQFVQCIWIFFLTFCPFIIRRNNNRTELVIMLSIIGITLFLTIFEPRTRYLYCYSPIIVICSCLGIYHIKSFINQKRNYAS